MQIIIRKPRKSKSRKRQDRRDKRSRNADLKRCYAYRNDVLKRMGYASYADYLQSPLWKSIRSKVMRRSNHRCVACRGSATEVHHRSYDESVMSGRNLAPLVAICHKCHQSIEFNNGQKASLAAANGQLKAKVKLKRVWKQKPAAAQDQGHIAYRKEVEHIKRTMHGRARNTALADAVRRRSANIGKTQVCDDKRFTGSQPTAEATAQR